MGDAIVDDIVKIESVDRMDTVRGVSSRSVLVFVPPIRFLSFLRTEKNDNNLSSRLLSFRISRHDDVGNKTKYV